MRSLDSLTAASAAADSLRADHRRPDSLIAEQSDRAVTHHRTADSLGSRAALLDTLSRALADSLASRLAEADTVTRQTLAALGEAHRAEVAALAARAAQLDSATVAARAALQLAWGEVSYLRGELVTVTGQRDAALALGRRAVEQSRRRHGWRTDAALLAGGLLLGTLVR